MAIINHAKREINAKIVYYGHEGTGKITSLRYLFDRIKPALRGEMKTLPSCGSTLAFFDFSPFEHPVFGGYRVRFHLYTLQGKVTNPAAWKMTLKGADGLVLLVDATPGTEAGSIGSINDLRGYLSSYGIGLHDVPLVLQVNKSDNAEIASSDAIAGYLGLESFPARLTTATAGDGVLEVLSILSRDIMTRISADASLTQDNSPLNVPEESEELALSPDSGDANPADVPAASENSLETEDVATEVIPVKLSSDVLLDGDALCIPLELNIDGQPRRIMLRLSANIE